MKHGSGIELLSPGASCPGGEKEMWRRCTGIEPAKDTSQCPSTGFEDQAGHQTGPTSADESTHRHPQVNGERRDGPGERGAFGDGFAG